MTGLFFVKPIVNGQTCEGYSRDPIAVFQAKEKINMGWLTRVFPKVDKTVSSNNNS